ncbi:hypothetical protein T4E_7930 [Trichinella pseudospiralis]|uniref:Apple domain-containing protein n=1 Tax=Trichinella pseudospiralis TaxID=6337 RepID=A0A0V0YMU9_TRIPS|nr:hypothetical protein T4E_7930 [Trichinella pseudospiralis]
MKELATFKSPRLICGIQFKLKSSVNQIQKCKFYKMLHVKLYVPKLDRICELESQNLNATTIHDNKIFQFNSTFEHCISIIYATTHTSGFNVFSYNKETTFCESTVEEENVNRFLNISIIALHEKCVVLRLPFSDNFQAKRLTLTFPNTLSMCIAYCRTFMTDINCTAVLHSSAENTCLLLQLKNQFNNSTKIMKSTSQLYLLIKCKHDTTPDATDPEYFDLEATNETNVYKAILQHSNMHCELIKLPLLAKYENNRISLWTAASFETCVWLCSPLDEVENICNSIYYSSEEESCLHLRISEEDKMKQTK